MNLLAAGDLFLQAIEEISKRAFQTGMAFEELEPGKNVAKRNCQLDISPFC
jgi:hypothetical protein